MILYHAASYHIVLYWVYIPNFALWLTCSTSVKRCVYMLTYAMSAITLFYHIVSGYNASVTMLSYSFCCALPYHTQAAKLRKWAENQIRSTEEVWC